jgi:hypothetical protein
MSENGKLKKGEQKVNAQKEHSLELNKEYTYSQICEIVGWKYADGNSKKAQIKEIESSYEFYHPVNKKTKKEKKSYIFTKQLKELAAIEHGGSHNTKNIAPMIQYLKGRLYDENASQGYLKDWGTLPYTMTTWYCDELLLLDEEPCTIVYDDTYTIEDYCKANEINNKKLFTDYVMTAKSVLKNIFLKALEHMQKNGECRYTDGLNFYYQHDEREVSIGNIFTDKLNDIVRDNETKICDELNAELHLSDKMKGRQLLMLIYGNEDYTILFNEMKISALMDKKEILDILNNDAQARNKWFNPNLDSVCIDRPIVGYYRGIEIVNMNVIDMDIQDLDDLGEQIVDIIRDKVRKSLLRKHYTNSRTGEIIYPYENCIGEMEKIEKLLFTYYEDGHEKNSHPQEVECDRVPNNSESKVAKPNNSVLALDDWLEDELELPFMVV